MEHRERETQIKLCFEQLYPGKAIDFIYPNEDQIYVYVDNLQFDCVIASDDDGFFYFIPVIAGRHVVDLCVRIRYPI